MRLLQCPSCCNLDNKESQAHSHNHLNSELSTSSSLSSQPSLPSVPSLTPQSQSQTTHHKLLTTINNHSSPIVSLALHGNAHQDHKIRVWKIETNSSPNERYKCIATLPTFNDRISKLFSSKNYVKVRRHKKYTWVHHVDTVSALALSSDGSLLYSASWDRTFKIWRTSDFKCLESVRNAHDDAINALVLSNDGVVYTGSADKKIKVWKSSDNKNNHQKQHTLLGTLEKHKSAVNALALSTDGSILYSGACDRSILVWENKSTNNNDINININIVLVGALRGHTKAILCLVVVADLVCSGSADNSVRIWRRGIEWNYSCLAVLEGHRKPVKCLAIGVESNNGGPHNNDDDNNTSSYHLYSGSLDCDIKLWQIRTIPTLS
ncbi:putative transcription factor WD40-like family [Lupinus albus]|uniref:Putative transcription factor WD40-like family n=1 Tax=Lupinus albus TaxID=3870 RepID=A0A6A4P5U9_LUPAL|nr:putative transcription factor WD40-like family [Lupinus albus]